MSRYFLLFLLSLPFVLAAILSQITQYKLNTITRARLGLRVSQWLLILAGIVTAEPLYAWLYSNGFTQTQSLSLFDVIQITGIIFVFYIANRNRQKIEMLEIRLKDLHQQVSIRFSKE
ncbi:hypothetical protein KBD20_04535 [Candidatus Saccharibacteria bacterium]|nr:hypothetical protein [Candidatus Saccharibacteria bacterium]